jgi:hypothetical protein
MAERTDSRRALARRRHLTEPIGIDDGSTPEHGGPHDPRDAGAGVGRDPSGRAAWRRVGRTDAEVATSAHLATMPAWRDRLRVTAHG